MNKMDKGFVRWVCFSFHLTQETYDVISTSKRRLIDVLQASCGRLIDVETTSSVYWEVKLSVVQLVLVCSSLFQPVLDFFNLCQGVFCFQNVRIYCFQYVRVLQVLSYVPYDHQRLLFPTSDSESLCSKSEKKIYISVFIRGQKSPIID